MLVAALLMAVLRSLPGPAFFPIRALAIVYVDFFRGVPTILVIFMLGSGIPALELAWLPTRRSSGRAWRSCSSTRRTSPRSIAPASSRCTRARRRRRARSASRRAGARYVVVPQAVRRVIPPLLNDFIGLQKDTALVGVLGVVEIRAVADRPGGDLQRHLLPRRRDALRRDHDPARALHRLARRPRPASPAGREARVSAAAAPALRARGHPQVLRQARGAPRDRPRRSPSTRSCA